MNLLCLAHDFKGIDLLKEARRQGCRTVLLTRHRMRDRDWPWDAIDELMTTDDLDQAAPLVCELMRRWRIDRVFPLQERDVERAAALRELLCIPGMTSDVARNFRDKFAMRQLTRAADLPNPAFVHLLNRAAIERYLESAKPPWMLKPRSEAGSLGIRRLTRVSEVWNAMESLGDEGSFYLLEQCVDGEVYHVDSIVHQGRVCFVQAHRYGTSPFEVWNNGGVFSSFSLSRRDKVWKELEELNARVLTALGLRNGVAHVEFVGSVGRLIFLEAAARVGGGEHRRAGREGERREPVVGMA